MGARAGVFGFRLLGPRFRQEEGGFTVELRVELPEPVTRNCCRAQFQERALELWAVRGPRPSPLSPPSVRYFLRPLLPLSARPRLAQSGCDSRPRACQDTCPRTPSADPPRTPPHAAAMIRPSGLPRFACSLTVALACPSMRALRMRCCGGSGRSVHVCEWAVLPAR